MRGHNEPCNTWFSPKLRELISSRHRKVKCDRIKPVCGRCLQDARQCVGTGYSTRLIMVDETERIVKTYTQKNTAFECSSDTSAQKSSPPSPSFPFVEGQISSPEFNDDQTIVSSYGRSHSSTIFLNAKLCEEILQVQLAVFCCRATVSLQTLGWVMSQDQWVDIISNGMQSSSALACAIHANAEYYLAKAAGAQVTPYGSFLQYESALRFLQRDLYDSVKQRSHETLFTVLLLGIFDVCVLYVQC